MFVLRDIKTFPLEPDMLLEPVRVVVVTVVMFGFRLPPCRQNQPAVYHQILVVITVVEDRLEFVKTLQAT